VVVVSNTAYTTKAYRAATTQFTLNTVGTTGRIPE
jgi:hypothetical protein